MSRQSHVVRTEDRGTIGSPRTLGTGTRALCAVENGFSFGGGDSDAQPVELAAINVESSADYQRCFVSAAISRVNAYVPDPPDPIIPGPGSWVVTFRMDFDVPDDRAWRSQSYFAVPGYQDAVATRVEWFGINEEYYAYAYCGIVHDPVGGWSDYEELWNFAGDVANGADDLVPPRPIYEMALYATERHGTCEIKVFLYSPHGEFSEDATISQGRYV